MTEGRAVSVTDADGELTTQEAAVLNVFRLHPTQPSKEGKIPSHKVGVGTHYRVCRQDVLAYKFKRREEAECMAQDSFLEERF